MLVINMLKTFLPSIFFLFAFTAISAASLANQFAETGYLEICDKNHKTERFDFLYKDFEELILFLQTNPVWEKKLQIAKERFIRSKNKNYYSSNFFGFYDESKIEGRRTISFYYSIHFHEFIFSYFPELTKIPEIIHFFDACFEIQKPYESIFLESAAKLGLETIFSSKYGRPPILLMQLVVILISARLLGEAVAYFKLPSVIGELVAGILIGPSVLGIIPITVPIHLLSQIGTILLLFEVGFETDIRKLTSAGPKAFAVAIAGVVLPFFRILCKL